MPENNFESEKQKILDKIFVTREDALAKIDEIVEKSQRDFSIDGDSHEVLFKAHVTKILNKILKTFIALFLMKEKGLIDSESINISELSKRLNVKKTSLSKPLGDLISKNLIKKDSEGRYSIVHHRILEILNGGENA